MYYWYLLGLNYPYFFSHNIFKAVVRLNKVYKEWDVVFLAELTFNWANKSPLQPAALILFQKSNKKVGKYF